MLQELTNIVSKWVNYYFPEDDSSSPNTNKTSNEQSNSEDSNKDLNPSKTNGGNNKGDTTLLSGTFKLYPDGRVSGKMVVKGDTLDYTTNNREESKRLKDNTNGKWSN